MKKTVNNINNVFTSYEGEEKSFVIPKGTVSVADGAFKGNMSIKRVTIPEGVTHLGEEAFMGCTSLESVSFPDSLDCIPARSFMGCTSLGSILIPGVGYIGDEAFTDCDSLRYVKVAKDCERVGISAFSGCSSLETVELPDSMKMIGGGAFYGCKSLKELTPAVDFVGIFDECFEGCDLLKETIEKRARLSEKLREGSICAVIVNDVLECFDDTVATDFVIPDGVTIIKANAFNGCTQLEELTIPDSIEEIELGAFDDCTNLSVINVPDNFTLLNVCDLYNTKWYKDRKKDDFVILGTVLLEYNGRDKDIAVPDGITAIVDESIVRDGLDRIMCYPRGTKSVNPDADSDIGEPMIAIYYN